MCILHENIAWSSKKLLSKLIKLVKLSKNINGQVK